MSEHIAAEPKMQRYIAEGTLDIPMMRVGVALGVSTYLSLGGDNLDGFTEFRPVDHAQASSSVFWSPSSPIVYECRIVVCAPDGAMALVRGKEWYEHLADRLTLWSGCPVRVLKADQVYNEDELRDCMAGARTAFGITLTGNEPAFSTLPARNATHRQLFSPPTKAIEAMRWLRRSMNLQNGPEKYLFLYIALESIAKCIPNVKREIRRTSEGDEGEGLESQESAAIRLLLARHPTMPKHAKKTLATIRARIAHGNANVATLALAEANLPALQQLVSDGLALAFGLLPADLTVQAPIPFRSLLAAGVIQYSADDNPAKHWDGLLSERHEWYLKKAKEAAGSDGRAS